MSDDAILFVTWAVCAPIAYLAGFWCGQAHRRALTKDPAP